MEQNFNYNSLLVRTATDENEETWFVGVDVCNILGYADSHQKIKSLEEDEYKLDRVRDGQGKMKETLTVNEFGLYSLILTSSKPEAKAFKRWITHEVLPSIRKAGKYTTDQERENELKLRNLASDIEELKLKKDDHQKKVNDLKKDIDSKTDEMLLFIKKDRSQLRIKFPETN